MVPEFGHLERVALPRDRCGVMVGSRFRVTSMASESGQVLYKGRATGPTEVSVQTGVLVVGLLGYRPTVTRERDPIIVAHGHAGS